MIESDVIFIMNKIPNSNILITLKIAIKRNIIETIGGYA